MRKTVFAIIFVALFLVACSAPKTTLPQAVPTQDDYPQAPSAPAVVAPTTDVAPTNEAATAPESGIDKALGTVDKETALKIDDVNCDKASRKITFRFQNIDDQKRTWNLDQALGWGAPKEQVNAKIFVNSYEANLPSGYMKDGERLFGTGKFSENCGGKVLLAYGEDVTCTLAPVPLKTANDLVEGNNEIMISALPSSKHIIQFLCN